MFRTPNASLDIEQSLLHDGFLMNRPLRVIVVSPVRNESKHLDRTIASVVRQSVRPVKWVIVNDGSTDATGKIADQAASAHDWIQVVHREDRGFRKSGSGVMDAFYDGFRRVEKEAWDVVVKLDGDLDFPADAFASILAAFEQDPTLGVSGGDIFHEQDGAEVVESKNDPDFHVRGATKFYRRECWQSMGGIPAVTGWDTLDEVKANMLSWKSRRIPAARFLHLRPTGAADGGWRNAFKNGQGSYISGYHPLYMLFKCIRRLGSRPVLIQSLGLFAGFFSSYFGNVVQIPDRELIRYLRKHQLRRLFGLSSIWR